MTAPDTSLHLRRALDGSDASLEWLVERFTPALLAQACYRMGPTLRRRMDPEDLVNEVWAVALGKFRELESRRGQEVPVLVKFLSTILLYRVNMLLRKQISATVADPEAVVDPRSGGVVSSAIRREAVSRARSVIESLAEVDREVLVLRLLEQRPASAVAEQLGISESLVYVRQHRGLQQLRERLGHSLFHELAAAEPGSDEHGY